MHTRPLRSMTKMAVVASVVAALAGISFIARTDKASAMSAPIHVTADVNMRSGPSTAYGRVGGIYAGTSPDFVCWTQGQNVGGVDVWFLANNGGAQGYYASYYDDSHYPTDSAITGKYGIPQCGVNQPAGPGPAPAGGSPAPAGPTSRAAQTAINWARPFADRRDPHYDGYCLTFVFNAYAAAGVNLRSWVNVRIGGNTYPQDIWGHFTHGVTGGGTPPPGALVFFRSRTGIRMYSHVALSIGGGNLVSTGDKAGRHIPYVHYETVAQHRSAIYLGWWLPV